MLRVSEYTASASPTASSPFAAAPSSRAAAATSAAARCDTYRGDVDFVTAADGGRVMQLFIPHSKCDVFAQGATLYCGQLPADHPNVGYCPVRAVAAFMHATSALPATAPLFSTPGRRGSLQHLRSGDVATKLTVRGAHVAVDQGCVISPHSLRYGGVSRLTSLLDEAHALGRRVAESSVMLLGRWCATSSSARRYFKCPLQRLRGLAAAMASS